LNLNDLARTITLKEGKRKSLPISQVKEVMKILLIELGMLPDDEIIKIIRRYRKYGRR